MVIEEAMDAAKLAQLKHFIEKCKSNPSLLHDPSLGFFKELLRSLGGQIPQNPTPRSHMMDESSDNRANTEDHSYTKKPYKKQADDGSEDEIIESDIELDGEVVEPDNDPPQQMGDPSIEVSEEHRDAAQMSKAKAMDALSEGKLVDAVEYLTEAIVLNPNSAILLATRASVFVKMNKPNAAIRDADAALQINPDSAKGHKYRGMARAMLGQWEEAASDLHIASNLDFDEDISSVLKKVEPNARKIEVHRRKYERLRKEQEMRKAERERQCRQTEAQGPESQDTESSAALQGGIVLSIHSSDELEIKFKAASKSSRLIILYFTATWCGPCRVMGPLYTSLAGRYPEVVFLKVDIDQLGEVAQRWNVNSVPTFFFVKNGKEIDKVVGADKSGLEKRLALHTSKP